MQLVERHVISKNDPRYVVIDQAAFASKNLYNVALYEIRQAFIHEGKYLPYPAIQKRMQSHDAYKALPAKVSQQILMLLDKNWKAFFEALKAYKEDPSKFEGRPKLPKYKHKTAGRNLLIYTMQAISGGQTGGKKTLQQGIIKPSQLPLEIRTKQHPASIRQVRMVPKKGYYVVEVIYEQATEQASVNPAYYAGIDLGTNNLIALTSNKPGFTPVVVNGRPVKSVNQFYNKRIKQLKMQLPKAERETYTSRMEHTTIKRNRRIDQYMHTASRRIIDLLIEEGIGTLVIGKNDGWKQETNMGKKNNQNFVCIPHARLIQMFSYKAELVGIKVVLTEESYTSVASFLDRDPLPVRDPDQHVEHTFSGRRVKRGLYRASGKRYINADLNGSYNIIRKVAPNAFSAEGVGDGNEVLASLVVHPVRIVVPVQSRKVSGR